MTVGLLGKKVGMTQVYDWQGRMLPVTVIEAGPCVVLQLRTPDRDGYSAIQVGFDDKPRRKALRSERGHVAVIQSKRQRQRTAAGVEPARRADSEPKRFVREFRMDGESSDVEVGQSLTVTMFAATEPLKDDKGKPVQDEAGNPVLRPLFVDVIGTTKGCGTAGVMKRHNFGGQPASHGAKKVHRLPGGIGAHATNRGFQGGIKKGKRMSGRYGHDRRTVRNLEVVRVDEASNMLLVKGAIPGPNGSYVMIRPTNKK